MGQDQPALSDSESDSELDEEEVLVQSSPRNFYGFGSGPGFFVAEVEEAQVAEDVVVKVKGVFVVEEEVEEGEVFL